MATQFPFFNLEFGISTTFFFNETVSRINSWIHFDDTYNLNHKLELAITDIASHLGETIKENNALEQMDELASSLSFAKNNPKNKPYHGRSVLLFASRARLVCLSNHFDRIDACVQNIVGSGCFSNFVINHKLENRITVLIKRFIDLFSRVRYLKSLIDLTNDEVVEIERGVRNIKIELETLFQFIDDVYIDDLENPSNSEELETETITHKKRGRKTLASDSVLVEIAKRVNGEFKLTSDEKGYKFRELFKKHTGRTISLERAKRNLRNLSRLSPSQTASAAP